MDELIEELDRIEEEMFNEMMSYDDEYFMEDTKENKTNI